VTLAGKNVVLGVSGSIAAYKAVYLTRLLVEAGAEVWPILTQAATRFVGPLTFSALTGHRAVTDMWSSAEAGEIGHVELAHRASAFVLAPASADLIARLALGRADEPLGAVALSTRAPWVVAPAMEEGMWLNPVTQGHVASLAARGARIVSPGEGALASGRSGVGRLAEPEHIFEATLAALVPQDLAGQRLVVTAGPTREAFDPARFLSNASSGKMGYAIARVARRRGAEVRLVTGPTELAPPFGVEVVRVTTTLELLTACQTAIAGASALIMAAAPADFRPAAPSAHKRKKTPGERFTVDLESNPDILRTLGARSRGLAVVGFAAESQDVAANARKKLVDKDLDLVVANDITAPGAGFAVDTNAVVLVSREGDETLPVMSKDDVASAILDRLVALLRGRRQT
jgi:phosphopantothenoylcysteine decarboxylase/phosphopantothenate--cysteine ligase